MLCTRLAISYCESFEQILVESRLGALDCCENIPQYLRSTEGIELRVGGYTNTDGRMSTSACILKLCWNSFRQLTNES